METFSALVALCAGNSPVTGEFPAQRPVTQSFDVFFDLYLYKRLRKQSWGWWFETPSRPFWRHCNWQTHDFSVLQKRSACGGVEYLRSLTLCGLNCMWKYEHGFAFSVAIYYNDVIMSAMASLVTCLTIVYSTVYLRRTSKKTSKLSVAGLCEANSPVNDEFPSHRASNAENDDVMMTSSRSGH